MMPKTATLMIGAALLAMAQAAQAGGPPRLLPLPDKVERQSGVFILSDADGIAIDDPEAQRAARWLVGLVARTVGPMLAPPEATDAKKAIIHFKRDASIAPEGYRIDVDAQRATIYAADASGFLHGATTFWQMMETQDLDAYNKQKNVRHSAAVPAGTVEDAPKWRWRGLMLDSARHFQSVDFIKTLLDVMAVHKFNVFHWHLVDDQGWRIDIDRYPRLVQVSSQRLPAASSNAPRPAMTGGYYTKQDIREIVAYAQARGIMVVPEIEFPGHALSAIRAYPELGTGAPVPKGVESDWGVFPWLYNLDDSTFTFLENIMTEVMELFPAPYIHVGNDEAFKDQWRASPAAQAKIRELGLADEEALQGWFTRRVADFLGRHGRKVIGWDEMLKVGPPEGSTIMSWHGIDGGIAAAKAGHDAILAPAPIFYFDNVQSLDESERGGRGLVISLEKVYDFDTSFPSLTPENRAHILGLQANLWTEYVRSDAHAAQMFFPRAAAIAEMAWNGEEREKFPKFARRLIAQMDRVRQLGLTPSDMAYKPKAVPTYDPAGAKVMVALSNEAGLPMRYTLDGRAPDAKSKKYTKPLKLAMPAHIRVASFDGADKVPGELERIFVMQDAYRKTDRELGQCEGSLPMLLEDDAPLLGPRPTYLVDIFGPCWIYEKAPMDGIGQITIELGHIPYNYQLGSDWEKLHFRPPVTTHGEIEVHAGTCDGPRIAVLPLGPALNEPGLSKLSAPVQPLSGTHNLCLNHTGLGPDPLWMIKSITLDKK